LVSRLFGFRFVGSLLVRVVGFTRVVRLRVCGCCAQFVHAFSAFACCVPFSSRLRWLGSRFAVAPRVYVRVGSLRFSAGFRFGLFGLLQFVFARLRSFWFSFVGLRAFG
jgi:hypothetical protein